MAAGKTLFKVWIALEVVTWGLILFAGKSDALKGEIAKLPPEVRTALESALATRDSATIETVCVKLDALGLHTLSENLRQLRWS